MKARLGFIAGLLATIGFAAFAQISGGPLSGSLNGLSLALGGLLYGGTGNLTATLSGNTTTQPQVLCQTGTGTVSAAPAWCSYSSTLVQSSLPMALPANGYMDTVGNWVIGAAPANSATAVLSATSGTVYLTTSAATLAGTSAGDVGRVVTEQIGAGPYTYASFLTTVFLSTTTAIGTLSGTGTWPPTVATISGVTISSTSGQLACTCSGFVVGQTLTISGTYGGTGSITGYSNPTTYYVSVVTSTTNITLQSINGTTAPAAIVTATGTPTGLTYTPGGTATMTNASLYETGPYPGAQATGGGTTFPEPLPAVFTSLYAYFPATAPIGTAGMWYCAMSSSAQGTCYNNSYYTSTTTPMLTGAYQPSVPASPTAFSGLTAGAYTQTTNTPIALVLAPVGASAMGLNGCESWDISALYGNSANAKSLIARPSFAAGGGSAVSGTTEGYTHILQSLCNSGAAGAQILTAFENTAASNAVQANSPITFALNTASAFVSAAAGNLISSGTDSETLVQYSLTLRPN